MANKNRAIARANRNIKNIASSISSNMDALYRTTYMTTPQQNKDLKNLSDEINSNIDQIVNRNIETTGMPSITKVYSRMMAGSGDSTNPRITGELEKMFDNGLMTDDIYGMFMANRYLRELDKEIDTVCRYMPRLEEALAVQRDCVLSADHFSKEFLSFERPGNTVEEATFSERCKEIKRKYSLAKFAEDLYDDISKYGEKFIYRVPYATAIGKLLATKPDEPLANPTSNARLESYSKSVEDLLLEDASGGDLYSLSMDHNNIVISPITGGGESFKESAVIMTESVKKIPNGKEVTEMVSRPVLSENERFRINIQIDTSGVIRSAVQEHAKINKITNRFVNESLANIHEARTKGKDIKAVGSIDWGKQQLDSRTIANDGLIGGEKPNIISVKAPGCVVKKLERDHVLPIYIDDMCLGYYYFEVRTMDYTDTFMGFKNMLGDPLTNMKNMDGRTAFNTVDNQRQDETIKFVAAQLSKFIDKKFVNSNQDLAKEIYMILKYNDLFNTPSMDLIKVSFIPPEDMVHCYFKLDPLTHRGISDLDKSLIPAKIYSSLYISNAIAQLTRSQDRRAYYVKQAVDTNIAQTLLNTIAQIKQGNFNIRQFQNINNILNIIGTFNDFVIPVNASGDPPIQFEVIPGQNVNTPTDLMEQLEEMAINNTGTPLEIIQARQSVDYAMQLTMSNSKFLRFCYKRQELFEDILSNIVSPIYNYEYDENVIIKVNLPPPTFINVTNTNQLIDNTRNFVQSIVDIEMADEQDDMLKQFYTKQLFNHYIGSHLDISRHAEILNRCKVEIESKKNESHTDTTGSDDYGY